MNRKWMKICIITVICLGILCGILAMIAHGLGKRRMDADQVQRIVLTPREDGVSCGTIELNKQQIKWFSRLYNHSICAGISMHDAPDIKFDVVVYFEDGSTIVIREDGGTRMYAITSEYKKHFMVDNIWLWRYINGLMLVHDLAG